VSTGARLKLSGSGSPGGKRGQPGDSAASQYNLCMAPEAPERDEVDERIARIEQLIDEYHATKNREVLQRARKLWRQAEVAQALHIQKIRAQIH
jgi:hypothetical protein